MQENSLLPSRHALQCKQLVVENGAVTIHVASNLDSGCCPVCQTSSFRIHSHYLRKLSDLPWHGFHVTVHWQTRKFFCDNAECSRRIFTERCPEVAASYQRHTDRLTRVLRCVAFSCGGEGGARLADRLGMNTSSTTLLRLIRHTPPPEFAAPRVVGVDDWAFRRGHRYGTIVCDLERRRVIELLPVRSATEFQTWLCQHPRVEVISRDRGECYIKGATDGAPNVTQVADRWHLLKNLRDAVTKIVDRHRSAIPEAVKEMVATKTVEVEKSPSSPSIGSKPHPTVQAQVPPRKTRRFERYQNVVALHRAGMSFRSIAKQLGIHRATVRRFVQAGEFPEYAAGFRAKTTDPFAEHIRKRWNEGCTNAAELARELFELGFKGSYLMVRRLVSSWRTKDGTPSRPPGESRRLSPKTVGWLLTRPHSALSQEEIELANAIERHCPSLAMAGTFAKEFVQLLKEQRVNELDCWIARIAEPNVPSELRQFACGLQSDLAAVKAAFASPRSNGQTEGQVNRLKLIKRQMYGRAKFDLLRQRVLHPG